MIPSLVSERCQLLRTWSSAELLEIEDVRGILEAMVANLCPTNGDVFWRRGGEPSHKLSISYTSRVGTILDTNLFHDSRADTMLEESSGKLASEVREQTMDGWGDEIEQYHVLNDLLKLTPMQVMQLYDTALTKWDIHYFVDEKVGGQWFWNNGESMLHTWILVMHGRGLPVEELREKVFCGVAGVTVDVEAERSLIEI